MEKDRLRGINTSSELVLLNVSCFDDFFISVSSLFQALKKKKISTPFLSATFCHKGSTAFSCCFTKEDLEEVKELVQQNDNLKKNACFTYGVGLLCIFPHRSNLNILGLSLSALDCAGFSLLGMSSSISSLIFVLKYKQLGKAVDCLKGCIF